MRKEVFIFKKNKCLEEFLCDIFHSNQWLERDMQMYSLSNSAKGIFRIHRLNELTALRIQQKTTVYAPSCYNENIWL